MSIFGSALSEARKKSGLTQEQLANQINVTRQALSHWENGRTLPDKDMIRQLSKILDTDFSDALTEDPQSGSVLCDEDPADPISALSEPRASEISERAPVALWKYLLSFLLGAAVACAVLLPIKFSRIPAPEVSPIVTSVPAADENTAAWYQQMSAAAPEAGKAYLCIKSNENPVKAVREEAFSGGVGWFYNIFLIEQGGIDFAVKEMNIHYFVDGKMSNITATYTAENFAEWFGSNVIPARDKIVINGGFQLQPLDGFGIDVTGEDANGQTMTFYGWIPFSQEITE